MAKKTAKPKDHVMTPQQVEFFWECVAKWQAKLGLTDWRIARSAIPPAKTMMCQMVKWDAQARQVCCRLNPNWGPSEKPTNKLIEQTAAHEMLHVLLHEVLALSLEAGAAQVDIDGAEHGVINRLEQLLVP